MFSLLSQVLFEEMAHVLILVDNMDIVNTKINAKKRKMKKIIAV